MAWWISALALVGLSSAPTLALDPDHTVDQYLLTRWTPDTGAPASISRLRQDRSGFLWLATRAGLYRFDGVNFEHIPAPLPAGTSQAAMPLLVTRNNDVLTWYRDAARFAVYRNGAVHLLPKVETAGNFVMWMVETPDGAVWASLGRPGSPVLQFKGGRWRKFGEGLPNSFILRLLAHPDGSVWAAYPDAVVRLRPGLNRFETVLRMPDNRGGPIVLDRQSRVWLATTGGTYTLTDPRGELLPGAGPFKFPSPQPMRNSLMLFDRDGSLWMNNYVHGLLRFRPPLVGVRGDPGLMPREAFTTKDGLTSDLINGIFEDREGNIWVGGTFGLNRFSNAAVSVAPEFKTPATFGNIIRSDRSGNVYVAEQAALHQIKPGGKPELWARYAGDPRTFCVAETGAIALITDRQILRIDGRNRVAAIPSPPQTNLGGAGSCAIDKGGSLWISVLGKVWVLSPGSQWRLVTRASDGRDGAHLLAAPAGGVYVNRSLNSIDHVDASLTRRTVLKADADLGEIVSLFPMHKGVIARGGGGLAWFGAGPVRFLPFARAPALNSANGMAALPDGTGWAYSPAGIVRFQISDLERAFASRDTLPVEILDYRDGLRTPGTAQQVQTIAVGGDGRVWFASDSHVATVNARGLGTNSVLPGIKITALDVDGKRVRDPQVVSISAGASELRLGFSALSLSSPQKVQVRYRLEGFDSHWVDPGLRREAFYTNLSPGTYRFQVIAANDAGVWNREGATLEFTIPPTFLQSIWFKLLIGLLAAVIVTIAYRLRLRQVTARMHAQFDIRTAERERIARELHDTLLQGIQGLMLRFQSVANRIPPDGDLRGSVDDALDRADAVLVEGRARVRDLRLSTNDGDLVLVPADLAEDAQPKPVVRIEGTPRALHPLVREEIQRISQEAVRNALHHAHAKSIEVALAYSDGGLRMTICDDGVGMPGDVLASGGKDGHFGLAGMRERATRIGAEIAFSVREGGGTEIALTLPARSAYRDAPGLWTTVRRLWKAPLA